MIVGLTSEKIGNEYHSQITSPDLTMTSSSTRITLAGNFVNLGTTQFDGLIGMAIVNMATGDLSGIRPHIKDCHLADQSHLGLAG